MEAPIASLSECINGCLKALWVGNNALSTQSALRYLVPFIYSPIRRGPKANVTLGVLSLRHGGQLGGTSLPGLYC